MVAGYLEIVVGSMFSGKTKRLIQQYHDSCYSGMRVVVINYAEDTRYHDSMLSTHDKIMIPCVRTKELSTITWANDGIGGGSFDNVDVILVNEAQFFGDLFHTVLEWVDVHKKRVFLYGLDGDFKRRPFGQILDLIPYSDDIVKLSAICAKCRNGERGIFSHRITRESSQIVIGSDNYMPLCRRCYLAEHI
jgi:thymidine kinase